MNIEEQPITKRERHPSPSAIAQQKINMAQQTIKPVIPKIPNLIQNMSPTANVKNVGWASAKLQSAPPRSQNIPFEASNQQQISQMMPLRNNQLLFPDKPPVFPQGSGNILNIYILYLIIHK